MHVLKNITASKKPCGWHWACPLLLAVKRCYVKVSNGTPKHLQILAGSHFQNETTPRQVGAGALALCSCLGLGAVSRSPAPSCPLPKVFESLPETNANHSGSQDASVNHASEPAVPSWGIRSGTLLRRHLGLPQGCMRGSVPTGFKQGQYFLLDSQSNVFCHLTQEPEAGLYQP